MLFFSEKFKHVLLFSNYLRQQLQLGSLQHVLFAAQEHLGHFLQAHLSVDAQPRSKLRVHIV